MADELRDPVAVVAFGGWNDAADAATGAVHHLQDRYPTSSLLKIDGEDYYDYQTVRPRIEGSGEDRHTVWPTVEFSCTALPHRDLVTVVGPEPNLRWRQFLLTMIAALKRFAPSATVVLGSMLSDIPHTRPFPVTGGSNDEALSTKLALTPSRYDGPVGITGVFADSVARSGLREVSLWTQIPHYVASSPNPKAILGLITHLESVIETVIDLGDLRDSAASWQRGIDDVVSEDPELAAYVTSLETSHDSETPEMWASGDEIAEEFEQYLRGRSDD